MKKSKLSKLRAGVPFPKTDIKKEREAVRAASKRLREANRDECLRLDQNLCRNPFCDCNDNPALECAIIDSHHILGKRKDNRFDGVVYRISLSRRCHTKYDKDRDGMKKILKHLRRAVPDFRWRAALKGLEEKWYLKV